MKLINYLSNIYYCIIAHMTYRYLKLLRNYYSPICLSQFNKTLEACVY